LKAAVSEKLTIQPVIRGEGEIRRASSSCHGARLDIAGRSRDDAIPLDENAVTWLCRECGQECERVLSEPEKVTFNG
jgi:hypothetical protein